MLRVVRLGGPQTLEIHAHSVGLTATLYHLEKLPDVKIQSKFSYPATDDCWAEFSFKGFQFWIDSPFSYIWIHGGKGGVPEPIFEEIESHMRKFNPWNIFEFPGRLIAGMRYILKPIPKWNEESSQGQ